MKRVRVIATGGTIASKVDPATGAARPALTGQDLVEALPGLSQAQVTVEQFANVASQALTLEQLLALAKRAREIFERGEADGVVITQGTMTLEESSYLWDLVLERPEPVVVTGAMRHTSLPGADGSRNLLDAVLAAASDATRGLGVLVCMNGELHAARDVVKTHSLDVDSFQSPDLGPLGFVRSGRAEVHRAPLLREHIPATEVTAKVYLVTTVAGDDGGLIEAAVERGADGLVLEAMGGGAVPPGCMPAVMAAVARVPVVAVSRCYAGSMYENVYGFAGGDKQLRELGVLFGGSLTGPKARIKLILALGAYGKDRDKVAAAFQNI